MSGKCKSHKFALQSKLLINGIKIPYSEKCVECEENIDIEVKLLCNDMVQIKCAYSI